MEVGRIGERVRRSVNAAAGAQRAAPTSDLVKDASASAMSRTRRFRIGAGNAAVDAVAGAIKATDEITGEATNFVRDAVIGVMEGTGQVARVGTPVIREVVRSAVKSSAELGGDMPAASQQAVAGAIVGAAAVGVDSERAGAQASAGVVKAVRDLGGDFEDVVAPAIHGVIIGVATTSGDLFEATRDTASSLVRSGLDSGADVIEVVQVITDEAIRASRINRVGTTDAVMGAAQGCVEAGYGISNEVGDAVRRALTLVVDEPVNDLSSSIRNSLKDALDELSEDLRGRPQAWRGLALWSALTTLIRTNGIDAGAALAYYMLLAFFPLVALIVVALSSFIDPDVIKRAVTNFVVFYFPSSQQFLEEALQHLFGAKLAAGLIAFVGMVLGAQGLFMAANRGVNRLFECRPRRILGVTVYTFGIVLFTVFLFLSSVGMTVVFRVLLGATEQIPGVGDPLNDALTLVAWAVAAFAPFASSGVVFLVVYKYLPNQPVAWTNATFGALVTAIIFEIAKYAFFWFGNMAGQRSLLYGSLSSLILLLIWSQVAGMIFLYGAALTKKAADLRPRDPLSLRERGGEWDEQTMREANIALGRDGRSHRWRARSYARPDRW